MLVLAALYPIYPRRFRWAEQLQRVELLTRQVFWVHIGFIVLLLVLQGVLLAGFPRLVLAPNGAATALLVGMLAFWLYRLVAQLFVYDPELWRDRPTHRLVHVVFTLLWLAISAVLGWALLVQLTVVADV
jgi:predicted neutral ceramidase superfamily lipid hydrolase